ncbi:MAG: hypothetical protein Q7R96_02505 [Nanoarchaeota archaeon]|nr:hypothetical protein [Nanoarchaeota archaeon]
MKGVSGQAVVTDVLIAMGLLILFSVFLIISLNFYQSRLQNDIEFNDASQRAMMIADQLVFSSGVPVNWTSSSVLLPGLVDKQGNLSYNKLANISLLNASLKELFHIGSYNFSLYVRYQNGSTILGVGESQPAAIKFSAASRRRVLYGNESAYIDAVVWKVLQ